MPEDTFGKKTCSARVSIYVPCDYSNLSVKFFEGLIDTHDMPGNIGGRWECKSVQGGKSVSMWSDLLL